MVLIDTNVWISYLLHSRLAAELHEELRSRAMPIVLCECIVLDLRSVPQRPKLSERITVEDVDDFLQLLSMDAYFVVPNMGPGVCRDPDDDEILYAARTAGAEFIVTHDKDLLVLGEFSGCRIVTVLEMLRILRSEAGEQQRQ